MTTILLAEMLTHRALPEDPEFGANGVKELSVVGHEKQASTRALEKADTNRPRLFVYEVLAELPAHYRSVLEAKYLEGLTVNQIAQTSRSTPKAVESLLARARNKFAQVHSQMQD